MSGSQRRLGGVKCGHEPPEIRTRTALSTRSREASATRRGCLQLILALLVRMFHPPRAAAEDRVEYRYEDYQEDHGRVHIRTHAVGFDAELGSRITAKGLLVYDGISGATPTGEAGARAGGALPLATIEDIRRAGSLDLGFRYGAHTTTPQFSYSEERDWRISRPEIDLRAKPGYQ